MVSSSSGESGSVVTGHTFPQRSTTNTADSPAPGGRTSRPARYWANAGAARGPTPDRGHGASAVGHVPQPVAALAQHREPVRDQHVPPARVRLEVDVRRVGVPDPPRARDRVPATGRIGRGDQGAPARDQHPAPGGERGRHRVVVEVLEHVHGHQGAEGRGGQGGGVVVHGRAGRGVPGRGHRPRRHLEPRRAAVRREPAQQVPGAAAVVEVGPGPAVAAHEPGVPRQRGPVTGLAVVPVVVRAVGVAGHPEGRAGRPPDAALSSSTS